MKVPQCEECEEKRKQLANNPIGGCAKCEHHLKADFEEPCKTCFKEYTPWTHYPHFSSLSELRPNGDGLIEEEEILLTELVEEEEEL